MRKLFIALAFAGFAMSMNAQETVPVQQYSVATNSFWSNWFVQAGADWSAWYSNEEHGLGLSHSPFKKFRSNPGASIAVGKWFTPGLGLRTKVQGIWGKAVTDDNNAGNGMKYWTANEQVMLNMSNLLLGYNPKRVWNVIPFAGAGMSRNCSANKYAMQLSLGLQSSWRVCDKMNVYVEGGWNRLEEDFDGYATKISAKGQNHRGWESKDNHLYAEVGLTFNLGKGTWNKVPDVDAMKTMYQSQIDALQSQLDDANTENARLKKLLSEQPKETKAVKSFASAPVSVFFNINRSNIASKKDLVNVKALAQYAKDNGCKLNVTGYADSATGSAELNQKLSEKRAATVADELVKMGIDRANINTVGKGGNSELSPVSFNRRATVEVAE
ncbi:OmpA family protein [Hallella absiana]|uniref:OmpA family protein n=1 Tax=Hallella absiana TaxID=2925336 RepID=UPI0021C99B49|nr:OmpA family protein [Hallella absiana]